MQLLAGLRSVRAFRAKAASSSCKAMIPTARRIALRSQRRPNKSVSTPTTNCKARSGTMLINGPRMATMSTSAASATALPGQRRRASRARGPQPGRQSAPRPPQRKRRRTKRPRPKGSSSGSALEDHETLIIELLVSSSVGRATATAPADEDCSREAARAISTRLRLHEPGAPHAGRDRPSAIGCAGDPSTEATHMAASCGPAGRRGSTNCGRKAVKKTIVFGVGERDKQAAKRSGCGPLSGSARRPPPACRHACTPSQIR